MCVCLHPVRQAARLYASVPHYEMDQQSFIVASMGMLLCELLMLTHVQECHKTNTHIHNIHADTCAHIHDVLYKNRLDTVRLKLEWYLCIYIYIVRVFSHIVCYKQMQALF